VGKHSLLGPLLRLRGPNCLTTDIAGFKAGSRPCAPYILVPHPLFSPFLIPCAWTKKKRGGEKRERAKEKREIGTNTRLLKALPLPSP
jgi:hypothetical protein